MPYVSCVVLGAVAGAGFWPVWFRLTWKQDLRVRGVRHWS